MASGSFACERHEDCSSADARSATSRAHGKSPAAAAAALSISSTHGDGFAGRISLAHFKAALVQRNQKSLLKTILICYIH
ncbi:hypothetical protein [Collimonas sp.]|jgi:hypothetical protein|uniref:hypothetical protein n=1 Tax=Collimonas sp. TaxID=1963772 RepID=UPI002B704B2C|nr:hypothetical protein [Collimonas sp.]HWX00973.1 hypothetical protein [Collimonas sp.]